MPSVPSKPLPDSRLALENLVRELRRGPWKFIRLRGTGTEEDAIDSDDVDLLGTRESVDALLQAALGWVRDGYCHLRVKSGTPAKVGLQLISTDARHHLDLDLWIDLRQIDDRKGSLIYQECAAAVCDPENSLQRLPVHLEASIFIHHLISKRKKISSPKQLARLSAYAAECRSAGQEQLALALESTAAAREIGGATAGLALDILGRDVRIARPGMVRRLARRLRDAISSAWFRPPGNFRMFTMMGCDGCGKTTLAKQLAARRDAIRGVYTGKHLYRKWFVYKLLVIFVRPLLFQGREKFDDTFAPLAYLLACARLRFLLLFRRPGTVIIDRSIMDFLMIDRKSDVPRFCSALWLASIFGARLPHIHFIVPFDRLRERKLEMTRAGHEIYDNGMFRHFSRRAPTDYVLFDNRGTLEDSVETLGRIVDGLMKPRQANQ